MKPNADIIAMILQEAGVPISDIGHLAVKIAETFDPPAVPAPASRPLCRDCADESVRQRVAPGRAICPHDGLPCTAPASSATTGPAEGQTHKIVAGGLPCPTCGFRIRIEEPKPFVFDDDEGGKAPADGAED